MIADMRDFYGDSSSYNWEFLKKDFVGVPLKHFVDEMVRYGEVEHEAGRPTSHHIPYYT